METLHDAPPCPVCGAQPLAGPEIDYRNGEVKEDWIIITCEADDHCLDTGQWAPRKEALRRWNRIARPAEGDAQ